MSSNHDAHFAVHYSSKARTPKPKSKRSRKRRKTPSKQGTESVSTPFLPELHSSEPMFTEDAGAQSMDHDEELKLARERRQEKIFTSWLQSLAVKDVEEATKKIKMLENVGTLGASPVHLLKKVYTVLSVF